jgi:prolyl oligopeptidase
MNRVVTVFLFASMLWVSCSEFSKRFPVIPVQYPSTFRDSTVVEDYHGTQVADPYRWLEDDNAPETINWTHEQNKITHGYINSIPFRDEVRNRMEELWNYEKYRSLFKESGDYYYFKNDGLQNHDVLYRVVEEGEDEVIIDPNTFSSDGTTALTGYSFSQNGKYIAYFIAVSGSDWNKAYVLDLHSMEVLPDELEWIKFSSIGWRGDGFYYSRYPVPTEGEEYVESNLYQSIYFHKLGTPQDEDRLLYRNEEVAQRLVMLRTTEDERYGIIRERESSNANMLKIVDFSDGEKIIEAVDDFSHKYTLIGNIGDRIIIQTNDDAPKSKLIALDGRNPTAPWVDFVPESEDVINNAEIAGDKVLVHYMHNATSVIKAFDFDGEYVGNVNLPGIGSVTSLFGKAGDNEAFFNFSSFNIPPSTYKLNVDDLTSASYQVPEIDFALSDLVTEQVWYKSKDGTDIPMFLTYHKDVKKDGSNPTMLYGYGGFNVSQLPRFSTTVLPILENGGIYAMANLRGGGEFGSEWHQAGTQEQKQNVFDDFIAAAEYLIEEGYTSSDKLAIRGGSNGGLLVGACMLQRPELFGVALPAVGVLDMLRYHKFTIGWAWAHDYGTSDTPEGFDYLYAYSPLHNVENRAYPATLVTTADHDDRVVPAHSFKFASELQFRHKGDSPVLIRVETSAGHGAGKPTSKILDEYADVLSFMFYNLNEEMSFAVKD